MWYKTKQIWNGELFLPLLKDRSEYTIILSLFLSQIYSWESTFSIESKTSFVYYLPVLITCMFQIFQNPVLLFLSLPQKEEKCVKDMFLIIV